MFQNAGFVTALEYSDIRKMVFRISTGSAELEWENYLTKSNLFRCPLCAMTLIKNSIYFQSSANFWEASVCFNSF